MGAVVQTKWGRGKAQLEVNDPGNATVGRLIERRPVVGGSLCLTEGAYLRPVGQH